jgi:hypothetical protein
MGDPPEDFGVSRLVKILRVGIKDAVPTKPVRLVELKIKANRWHERASLRA